MSVWRRPPARNYLDRLAENIGQGLDVAAAVRESSRRNVLLNLEWICLLKDGSTVRGGAYRAPQRGENMVSPKPSPNPKPNPNPEFSWRHLCCVNRGLPCLLDQLHDPSAPKRRGLGRVCQRAESAMRSLVWFRTSVMDW